MNEKPSPSDSFEQAARQAKQSLLGDFIQFTKHNKKYWMIPLIVVLLLLGLLLMLGGTAAAPFIYTLF